MHCDGVKKIFPNLSSEALAKEGLFRNLNNSISDFKLRVEMESAKYFADLSLILLVPGNSLFLHQIKKGQAKATGTFSFIT